MDETLATAEELTRAEDQGNYWRIICDRDQNPARYIDYGQKDIANFEAFTSRNAKKMEIDDICKLIEPLPEYRAFWHIQLDCHKNWNKKYVRRQNFSACKRARFYFPVRLELRPYTWSSLDVYEDAVKSRMSTYHSKYDLLHWLTF